MAIRLSAGAIGEVEMPGKPGSKIGLAPDGQSVVDNAGLVLLDPFLPHFFRRLDLLTEDHKGWRSPAARDRAVHLLQWLVDGRCDRTDEALVLNKMLCGQALDRPAFAAIEPSEEELAVCRSLLEAVLAAWPALKGSSVAALQETFLQRGGRIVRIETGWRVDLERKVVDVLIDTLPWSFSMILHPWMREPVSVRAGASPKMASRGVETLRLLAFTDDKFSIPADSPNLLVLAINPASFSLSPGACFTDADAAGGTGEAQEYNSSLGATLSTEFIFDATGAVPGAGSKDVAAQISDFRRATLDTHSAIHSPNYLELAWGKTLFKGRLKSLDIEYTLFNPDGSPLRAKAKASFVGFQENQDARIGHVSI